MQTLAIQWTINQNKLSQTTQKIDFFSQDIFYSRKNFERPELQLKPYRSFKHEVASFLLIKYMYNVQWPSK